jgi:ribose transport system permease protein
MTAAREPAAVAAAPGPEESPATERRSLTARLGGIAPIFIVLAVLLIVIGLLNPRGFDAAYYLALLKRAAPLMVLAVGQLFVIVSGEFDLSVGSIVTLAVVAAAVLTFGDPALTYPVIGVLLVLGVVIGLTNGVISTRIGVPSFLTTLGMLLVLNGAVAVWTSGAPRGSLPENLRAFGRAGVDDLPLIGQLPYAVLVLTVVGVAAWLLLHRSNFGRQVFAVGGNARAAALAGTNVASVKTAAFVISGVAAIVAGILLAGFGGLANRAGEGYEFQSITAVVLGGAVLGGGRGSVGTALAGALTLEALFTMLNFMRLPVELRFAVQGVIVIAAVAYASFRLRRSA